MSSGVEIVHLIKHAARQQMQDVRTHYFGHCSAYDPTLHAVRVLIPTLRDANDNMYETGWLQLGTLAAGDGLGIQYAPFAQATQQDLTKGEQCQVMIFERDHGTGGIANLTFYQSANPPGQGHANGSTEDPTDPNGDNKIQQGELIIKHKSGSFIKFYQNGDIQVNSSHDLKIVAANNLKATVTAGNLTATVVAGNATVAATVGSVTVTAGSNVAITATANTSITAATATVNAPIVTLGTGAQQQLLNEAMLLLFNTHQHIDSMSGATTGPVIHAVPGVHSTVNTTAS